MRRQVCDAIDNKRRLRRCLTTRKACSNSVMIGRRSMLLTLGFWVPAAAKSHRSQFAAMFTTRGMVFGCFNLCRNLGIFKSGEEVVRRQKSFGAGGRRYDHRVR